MENKQNIPPSTSLSSADNLFISKTENVNNNTIFEHSDDKNLFAQSTDEQDVTDVCKKCNKQKNENGTFDAPELTFAHRPSRDNNFTNQTKIDLYVAKKMEHVILERDRLRHDRANLAMYVNRLVADRRILENSLKKQIKIAQHNMNVSQHHEQQIHAQLQEQTKLLQISRQQDASSNENENLHVNDKVSSILNRNNIYNDDLKNMTKEELIQLIYEVENKYKNELKNHIEKYNETLRGIDLYIQEAAKKYRECRIERSKMKKLIKKHKIPINSLINQKENVSSFPNDTVKARSISLRSNDYPPNERTIRIPNDPNLQRTPQYENTSIRKSNEFELITSELRPDAATFIPEKTSYNRAKTEEMIPIPTFPQQLSSYSAYATATNPPPPENQNFLGLPFAKDKRSISLHSSPNRSIPSTPHSAIIYPARPSPNFKSDFSPNKVNVLYNKIPSSYPTEENFEQKDDYSKTFQNFEKLDLNQNSWPSKVHLFSGFNGPDCFFDTRSNCDWNNRLKNTGNKFCEENDSNYQQNMDSLNRYVEELTGTDYDQKMLSAFLPRELL